MIINHSSGNFKGSKYKLATTDLVEYFPVYITFENKRFNTYDIHNSEPHERLCERIINDVYLYRKPERITPDTYIRKGYDNLFSLLEYHDTTSTYVFTNNGVQHSLNVMRGYIADSNDNILLLVTTKDFFIFDEEGILRKDVLKLYVSTEFMKNEIYKNMYKKLTKDYISKFYDDDIEVVFMSSAKIEATVFKNNFSIEFNNLTELSEILSTEPTSILEYNFEPVSHPPDNVVTAEVEEDFPF